MRRKEKEITDRIEMERVLMNSRVCRVAMVDGDRPYIVPLHFGYRDGVLYFHSAREGRKIDLIRQNPRICCEVDELIQIKPASKACDWGTTYKSLVIYGEARFVDDPKEKKQALDVIMAHYADQTFDYPERVMAATTVIRMAIETMTGKQS